MRFWPVNSRRPSGFSMVELLIVIMIILFLMGVIAVVFVRYGASAKNKATQSLIHRLSIALSQYEAEFHELPPDTGYGIEPGSETKTFSSGGQSIEVVLYDAGSLYRYLGQEVTKYVAETPGGLRTKEAGKYGPFTKFNQETELKAYTDSNYGESFMVVDPWGSRIGYIGDRKVRTFDGNERYGGRVVHNRDGYDIFSAGADKKTAIDDDKDNGFEGTGGTQNDAYNGQDDDGDGVIDNASELGEARLNGTLTPRKSNPKTSGTKEQNEVLDDLNSWDN